jgi:hypothetical protein
MYYEAEARTACGFRLDFISDGATSGATACELGWQGATGWDPCLQSSRSEPKAGRRAAGTNHHA